MKNLTEYIVELEAGEIGANVVASIINGLSNIDEVIDMLQKHYNSPTLYYKTIVANHMSLYNTYIMLTIEQDMSEREAAQLILERLVKLYKIKDINIENYIGAYLLAAGVAII